MLIQTIEKLSSEYDIRQKNSLWFAASLWRAFQCSNFEQQGEDEFPTIQQDSCLDLDPFVRPVRPCCGNSPPLPTKGTHVAQHFQGLQRRRGQNMARVQAISSSATIDMHTPGRLASEKKVECPHARCTIPLLWYVCRCTRTMAGVGGEAAQGASAVGLTKRQ